MFKSMKHRRERERERVGEGVERGRERGRVNERASFHRDDLRPPVQAINISFFVRGSQNSRLCGCPSEGFPPFYFPLSTTENAPRSQNSLIGGEGAGLKGGGGG